MRYRCKKYRTPEILVLLRGLMVLACDAQAVLFNVEAAPAAATMIFYCHMKATELIKWSAKVTGRMRKKLATSQASFAAGRGGVFGKESEFDRTIRVGVYPK